MGVQARVGERIVEINGHAVTRETPPQALLVNQPGAKVELVLETDTAKRTVLVTTLSDEVPARYRDWVEAKRAWVHARSQDKVGYVHIPDMMSLRFAEFHRYFIAECDRDGLIVDVRYNRGGHVSQLLLEKVARKRIAYDLNRWHLPMPYPFEVSGRSRGRVNQRTCRFRRRHLFAQLQAHGHRPAHRHAHLGRGDRDLAAAFTDRRHDHDAAGIFLWWKDGGWSIENYGTDPTIVVDNAPQDYVSGRDAQLEKSLEVVLEFIADTGDLRPEFGPRPNLARNPLPPRK